MRTLLFGGQWTCYLSIFLYVINISYPATLAISSRFSDIRVISMQNVRIFVTFDMTYSNVWIITYLTYYSCPRSVLRTVAGEFNDTKRSGGPKRWWRPTLFIDRHVITGCCNIAMQFYATETSCTGERYQLYII